jgi:hypothetical protein
MSPVLPVSRTGGAVLAVVAGVVARVTPADVAGTVDGPSTVTCPMVRRLAATGSQNLPPELGGGDTEVAVVVVVVLVVLLLVVVVVTELDEAPVDVVAVAVEMLVGVGLGVMTA